MKHVFVINPKAGSKSAEETIRQGLYSHGGDADWEIYITKGRGDARDYVRRRCEGAPEDMRFYACGGDGTLNEVVNGAVGFLHAAVGVYPCGSGNDYVKYYGGKAAFLDFDRQLRGQATPVDLMRVGDRLAINMVHFGLDAKVAAIMGRIRRMPIIGGRNAYMIGIIGAFVQRLSSDCRVMADGEQLGGGRLLLCTLACGKYVGGSYCAAPRSNNADGLMDICLVKPISRLKFVSLIGAYKAGRHLDDPRLKAILVYRQAKQVMIQARAPYLLSLDGELLPVGEAQVDIVPAALRFIVPAPAAI